MTDETKNSTGATYVVSPETPPTRLDRWLADQVPGLSRRVATKMLASGDIKVDGRRAKKNWTVAPGQCIAVHGTVGENTWTARPEHTIPLQVRFEDANLLVVDKPSGVPTVPLTPEEPNTLAGAIAKAYPECAPIGRNNGDSGLIQRLDTETSGLLIAARNERAFAGLMDAQYANQIEKTYLALVNAGIATPQTLAFDLAASPRNRKKVQVVKEGNPAVTYVDRVRRGPAHYLLKVTILKGFRHQIRVHLAHIGYPIAGDCLYDGPAIPELKRLFLHASGLKFLHPATGEVVTIESPLPDELEGID